MKKAHITGAAPGTLAGGRGKECFPSFHTASASLLPPAQFFHVVHTYMFPGWITLDGAEHLSAACSRAISVVTGSGSRPFSPGL